MKKATIGESACVLVFLFSSVVAGSGAFGNPLTDDVSTLASLRENIPKDYKIPVKYIPKEVGGMCWLQLSLYPVESSLKRLAQKFGNLSSNRENITMFITMLQGLRFTIDNQELEAAMQVFHCHYRRVRWLTGRYFDFLREVFSTAARTPGKLHCAPPPCPMPPATPATPGREKQNHERERLKSSLLALLLIPITVILFLSVWLMVDRMKGFCADRRCEAAHRGPEAQHGAAPRGPEPHHGAAQRGPEPHHGAAPRGPEPHHGAAHRDPEQHSQRAERSRQNSEEFQDSEV